MRTNKPQKVSEITKLAINQNDLINSRMKPKFTKKELWHKFSTSFYLKYGKEFHKSEDSLANLKVLFFYFLKDERFYDCKNLRKDINNPNLNKGLLIVGGYGCGKTACMSVLEGTLQGDKDNRFKGYSSKAIVRKYESCETIKDKDQFNFDMSRKVLFIDDITSEKIASNYGHVEIIEEVLADRYAKNLRTYATCNYSNPNLSVTQTIDDIGARYGGRIHDRFFEMFNVIEFKGKSFR